VRAYVSFVCENEENDSVVRALSELIPAVIEVCKYVVHNNDEDDVPLQCLGDLATSVPKLLVPHLNDVFTLCIATINDAEKDDSYRQSSLEVMISFSESSPNVMRKKGVSYVPSIIQQCLHLMTELDEDIQEWADMDDADDDIEEENASLGETSLDRLSCALGGKTVLPHALHCIDELLKSTDWKCRHAGVMALSTIGEGCKRQMESVIHEILIEMVLPRLVHTEHARVRYAACNAIGQMCTDFAPTIQKRCHEKIVPALLATLGDLQHPRVAAHAGAAIVNFCEDCPKTVIKVYLNPIMEKMENVLSQTYQHMMGHGKKIVLEQVITSIASVADAAQDYFIEFYGKLMPPLKYILENSNTDSLKLLRGKTIECVSLIGLAVGREVFQQDADQIMKILLSSGTNFQQPDDPQVSYLISAWARICKILGEGFAPYLSEVMPAVMAAADLKPDVAVVDDDEADDNDEEWNYISLGEDRSLGIKTAGLEDKVTACEMLVCYARELKGSFAPYVEGVMKLMLPLMKFVFHDGVRSAAAECLPCLMSCAQGYGLDYLKQMWNVILPAYKDAIEKETDLEVLCEQFNGIAQCLEDFGETLVSDQDMQTIYALLHEQMVRFEKRRAEREKKNKDEELDEEDEEHMKEVVELETSVLARISDVIHYSFAAYKERLLPFFDPLVPQFAALLDSRRPYQDRQWGICIFDDVIEFTGESSLRYQHIFFQPIVNALVHDEYPEVRQAAAYGCGIMAQKGGPGYAEACAQLLNPLAAAIAKPSARSTEEDSAATENAISAVSKILQHNSSAINTNEVIPAFIGWLPIWNDLEEVPHVYNYFCDLVEANHPLVLGDNGANLPQIFNIILQTFTHGVFDDLTAEELKPVKQRLINIMKMIQANTQLFQSIVNGMNLNSNQREVLTQMLT
jgi:hypothetical protein